MPVFEHPDRKNIEKEYGRLEVVVPADEPQVEAKVVEAPKKSAAKKTTAQVKSKS